MNEFWMVWCDTAQRPTKKHDSPVSAEAEAERLARLNPGDRFYVLHGGKYAWVSPRPVEWVKLDELPF